MGRKRGCEWCMDNLTTEYIEHRNGYCLWAETFPFTGHITVTCQANDEDGEMIEDCVDLPMRYCPNCGRKLADD